MIPFLCLPFPLFYLCPLFLANMKLVDFLVFFAAILTTVAYIPQALKTIRTRHTRDLSLAMYSVLNVGLVAWLVYGIFLVQWPIIFANIVTLLFTLPILYFKIKYK